MATLYSATNGFDIDAGTNLGHISAYIAYIESKQTKSKYSGLSLQSLARNGGHRGTLQTR